MARDSVLPYFEPLSDVAYIPSRYLAEALDISESNAVLCCTFQMSFLLSLGFNLLSRPIDRKIYSTLTGLFLGFYMHGLGYLVCLF